MSKANWFVTVQFLIFAIYAFTFFGEAPSPAWLGVLGALLLLIGVGIALKAIADFQRGARTLPNVTPVATQGAQLVEVGLYARIRHPIYTGVIVAAFGGALLRPSWLMFALAGLIVAFFWVKSRYEESLLRQAYAGYAAYMGRTGRFWPRLGQR